MANPRDVLAQLLSESQADVLSAVGAASWQAITRVLNAVMDAAPALQAADGRLVMPDEIAGNYTSRHLSVPVDLVTNQDQSSTAYLTFSTPEIAAFFEIKTDDPADEEQQVVIVGTTIAGQVVNGLNDGVFHDASNGLVLSLGQVAADGMAELLDTMDEPALYLTLRLEGAVPLECAAILPGTFLDIMGSALPAPAASAASLAAAAGANLPFSLTAEEIDAAELVELPLRQETPATVPAATPELAGVGAGLAAGTRPGMANVMQDVRNQAGEDDHAGRSREPLDPMAGQLPPRPPTPITDAPTAQRARFAPLPEPATPAYRGNMDLLSTLQMNVTVELGRTQLTVAEVLSLGSGSVIELDRLAGEPVDILVNDRIIARGEVVVVDENFGVRVVEVVRRGGESEERAS